MPSAWQGLDRIIKDIIIRFDVKLNVALEFGVEYGFSTSAFANYFDKVIGVDTFMGDIHTKNKTYHYESTKNNLEFWSNIDLVESSYQDFIKKEKSKFDLIHIDIVHTYKDTYKCGEWAVKHSDVVLFHDTESFKNDVGKAVKDLAIKYNLKHYNYKDCYGLGILVNN